MYKCMILLTFVEHVGVEVGRAIHHLDGALVEEVALI